MYIWSLRKDDVKYLGVLLDSNLSWRSRIDNVALKVSRTVGVVARLRHFVPRTTLLNIIFYFIFCLTLKNGLITCLNILKVGAFLMLLSNEFHILGP